VFWVVGRPPSHDASSTRGAARRFGTERPGVDGMNGRRASTSFAPFAFMTRLSHSARYVVDSIGRVFGRVAAMMIGFILTAVGLGMMVTIVMFPMGVVLGLLGIAIFLAGLFAHIDENRPVGDS
jgi:hypothetical protein